MALTLREPTYCTPEDVAETLDLPDPMNPNEIYQFTDISHPTYERVQKMILTAEDEIDRRMRRSWRTNRVVNHLVTIPNYQWDENGWRSAYYQAGGYMIQLRKDILPWDPEKGDKLELRNASLQWRDISEIGVEGQGATHLNREAFWFDYPAGRLFLRTRLLQPKFNALRITYRYGNDLDSDGEENVPMAINRLASLIVASNIIVMDFHSIKVGMGGDVSGLRDQLLNRWGEEINRIYSSYQRSGSVHSLLR